MELNFYQFKSIGSFGPIFFLNSQSFYKYRNDFFKRTFHYFLSIITSLKLTDEIKKKTRQKKNIEKLKLATQHQI